MLKRAITFQVFDSKADDFKMVTEDFYFNLTKAELAEMFLSHDGGNLAEYLQEIVRAEKGGEVIAAFKKIISAAVGQRSEDGRRFVKSPEITADFMESEAYSELFMELLQRPDQMADFIKGIVPTDMVPATEDRELPAFTDEQLLAMSDDEFSRVAGRNPRDMTKQHLQIAYERKNQHKRAS